MSDQSDLSDYETYASVQNDSSDNENETNEQGCLSDNESGTIVQSDSSDNEMETNVQSDLSVNESGTIVQSDLSVNESRTIVQSDLSVNESEKIVQSDLSDNDEKEIVVKEDDKSDEPSSIYEFTVKDINGNDVSLEKYKGHVLIIVNVSSECALTRVNYHELEHLHRIFADTKGLRILAFPCDQFGIDEPESQQELVDFLKNYNASFETFDLVNVNGENAHPLWKYLQDKLYGNFGKIGKRIKWNYTKFIIDKNGHPVERHGPLTNPARLLENLKKYWD